MTTKSGEPLEKFGLKDVAEAEEVIGVFVCEITSILKGIDRAAFRIAIDKVIANFGMDAKKIKKDFVEEGFSMSSYFKRR